MDMTLSEPEIIAQITTLLDSLGPFPPKAPRKDMWRTTEQLTYELVRLGFEVDLDDVDQALSQYEVAYRERLANGRSQEVTIRRATYPDRTTALPLWGSTRHHGQPWRDQAAPERLDEPRPVRSAIRIDESAPRAFLSHTHGDGLLAAELASVLANMGIGTWMFESDIEYRGPVAKCVRAALDTSACCIGLLTRTSIASLWVLTELHTALECKKPVVLVINVADGLLLDLLRSVRFQNPDGPFDFGVRYDEEIAGKLHADYRSAETESRARRYPSQVQAFLETLPAYLAGRPALGFPYVPPDWSGSFAIDPIESLLDRCNNAKTMNFSAGSSGQT
jgi:TIR domain